MGPVLRRGFQHRLVRDDVGRPEGKVTPTDQQVAAEVQQHCHIDQDAAPQQPVPPGQHSD